MNEIERGEPEMDYSRFTSSERNDEDIVQTLGKRLPNIDNPKILKTFPPIDYKFGEDRYVEEIMSYIDKTYSQHYSKNKFQATEFIMDAGHGTGFCIGNVLKYAQRYRTKGTDDDARKDLMKVIHYAILQLYVHDNNL